MPTYEYACKSCEHSFEEFQSIKAPALKKCPACGRNALERLVGTGAALIFKGSGFYQTDYRSESYKKAAEADSKAAAPAADAKPSANGDAGPGEAKAKSGPDTVSGSKADGPPAAAKSGAKKPRKAAAMK